MNTERMVGHIEVVDSKGKHQKLCVYQEFVDTSTFSERDESPGLWRLIAPGNLDVEQLDNLTFEIRSTGEILRKV